ncbi:hypothetical protein BA190_09940 [Labrys sp. WJW]|uniref:tetratricopeptide repeat protein n=1 Tax=Labrys sp. WJW TaxID=1737983 RepID=UPI00082EB323|nr:tetratricopeptide repeat protein [Labrys sp. WJW]OCC05216.1 hypothetical protein BA190_09940 [Labrys sp. WJW]
MKRIAVAAALALPVLLISLPGRAEPSAPADVAQPDGGEAAKPVETGTPAQPAPDAAKPVESTPGEAAAPADAAKPAEAAAPAAPAGPPPDLAYGAFQRGYYLKALEEATKRVVSDKDPAAMTLIAQLYANGLGVPPDPAKAAQWYSEAAERGDRNAMFAYGMTKLLGKTVPKDEPGGMLLLNRAAELGVPEAAYNLGIIALRTTNGPPDYATAYKRFSQAALANNGDALYSLGVLTKEGKGVPADKKKAADYFLASANTNNVDGMVEYAIALFNGEGVPRDQEMAADWFERAALRGSPIARNRLARMYAAGMGLAPNPVLACMWHLLAKAAGLEDKQLDEYVARQTPEVRAAAIQGARFYGM